LLLPTPTFTTFSPWSHDVRPLHFWNEVIVDVVIRVADRAGNHFDNASRGFWIFLDPALHVRGILRKLGRQESEAVLAADRGGYLSNGTFGMEAAISERTIANADHKASKLSERKRYTLKRIGWYALSTNFEP
jgi:hypothetical protein